jgi:hypothetical protein
MDFWDLFIDILRGVSQTPLFRTVNFPREMEISRGMAICPLQDPLRFRARFLALEIASALIDDQGNLRLDLAQSLHQEIQRNKYLIGPSLENETFLFEHIQSSLETLLIDNAFQKQFLRLSPPLCHKGAERLIRDTLWPQPIKEMQAVDVKRAVLAAWFTWLRQTTGSCFATAPAILIQEEQPLRFLQDIFDLLMTGALRRVAGGHEYAVPLCPSMEQADLLRSIGPFSPDALAFSPGLLAAFGAAGLFEGSVSLPERRRKMRVWIEREEEAKTPKELIESVLLRVLGLERSDVKEEEGLKRLEMSPLLARQSAVYYQKPSERAKKVSEWKEKSFAACSAYQSLGDCALLRAWEATMASFSDVKVDIGRWNLYNSMGMHPDHPGGIGAFLYERINIRLQKVNQEIVFLRNEYERAVLTARNAERMGLSAEWSRSMYTANSILPQIEQLSKEAEKLANLLSKIIGGYDRLIPESFQEIFDPSLTQNLSEMIDDSPAGFRLAFKHGRSASSQWTFIRSSEEFIRSLREFFEYAERELSSEMAIEELSTELIQFIQTEEFLQGAIQRAKANPTMQGKAAKPWEYISGGSLPALLQTYYNRTSPFTILERKIQNEEELIAFLSESVVLAPSSKRVLMHSPTHAFILRPDWFPTDPMESIERMAGFWKQVGLQDEEWLAERFSLWLPRREQALFLHRSRQKNGFENIDAFRNHLIDCAGKTLDPLVDAFLYESLPLIHQKTALIIGAEIGGFDQKRLEPYFADASFFTPVDFKERLKAAFIARARAPFSEVDLDANIAASLRERNLAAPMPILFADTNWSAGFFGLAISPQGSLNLWRFHRTGMTGTPMRAWFDLQKEGSWIVLCRPKEYT